MEEYTGDIIRIDRLIDFTPSEYWEWDFCGKINLDDISIGIHESIAEISEPYGDTLDHIVLDQEIGISEESFILSIIQKK